MLRADIDTIRRGAAVFIGGAIATAVSGVAVQAIVQPSTDLSDDFWRFPWSSAGAFVVVSLVYALMHVLVVVGLVAFGRSGVAGTSPAARAGVNLSVIGTLLLAAGELASLPIRNAHIDDTSAAIVGAVFGLGVLMSAVGLLVLGKATLSANRWQDWRRWTPLVAGVWTAVLVGVSMTKALPTGVAVYGLCLLGMAVALYSQPQPSEVGVTDSKSRSSGHAGLAR
jgi:hypothetical protein